jgi:feruloyl esterase
MHTPFTVRRRAPLRLALLAAATLPIAWALSGCLGDDSDNPTPTETAQAACTALSGSKVAATSIGLPTGGADITSATLTMASEAGNTNGEYCKVLGAIHPRSP